MKKIFTLLGLLFIVASCQNKDDNSGVVSQKFVHKYGFEISEKEWSARNKNGQVVTSLQNGVIQTSSYSNGQLHGIVTYTFPNSEIIQEKQVYSEGKLVKKTLYEPSGLPTQEFVFDTEGTKIITIWDKNGVPLSMEEYDSGLLWSARYFNSQNEIEASITDGNGTRIQRDQSGKMLSKEKFENGKLIARTTFHANHEIQSECTFDDYQLHGVQKTFSPDGKLLTTATWNKGKLEGLMQFYRNGVLFTEIAYKDGKKHGTEKEYSQNNELIRETHWENDQRHGSTCYHSDDFTDTQWFWRGTAVDFKRFKALECREQLLAEINGEKPILEQTQTE